MWEVKWSPESVEELEGILNYYEENSQTVAHEFREEVLKKMSALKINPWYQIRYQNVRCLPFSRFPYMLHFEIDEGLNLVKVLGCIHTSSHPDNSWKWK